MKKGLLILGFAGLALMIFFYYNNQKNVATEKMEDDKMMNDTTEMNLEKDTMMGGK